LEGSLLGNEDISDRTNGSQSMLDKGEPSHAEQPQRRIGQPTANIVLIGSMASGKSAVGWRLAKLIGFGFFDLDSYIESKAQRSIAEIFMNQGEEGFREQERLALAKIEKIRNHVVALGGGCVLDPDNWRSAQNLGVVVWLDTPPSEIAQRLVMKPDEIAERPLLQDVIKAESKEQRFKMLHDRIAGLLQERRDQYSKADVVFTDSYSTPDAAAQVLKGLLSKEGVLTN